MRGFALDFVGNFAVDLSVDFLSFLSGKGKEPKPKLFGPDIFRWGGGLPREGVRGKKFGMCIETQAGLRTVECKNAFFLFFAAAAA